MYGYARYEKLQRGTGRHFLIKFHTVCIFSIFIVVFDTALLSSPQSLLIGLSMPYYMVCYTYYVGLVELKAL